MARIFYYGLKTRLSVQGNEIYGSDNFCDAKSQLLNNSWDVIGVNMGAKHAENFIKWAVVQTDYFIVAFPTYSVPTAETTEFKDAADALPRGRGKIVPRVLKMRKMLETLIQTTQERAIVRK